MSGGRAHAVYLVLVALVALPGCERDPAGICPPVEQGDLVLSEIRGPQSGDNSYAQWIEIFNASSRSVDLTGLTVIMNELDGNGSRRILVREGGVLVEPGEYAVLGRVMSGREPDYISYGYEFDFSGNLYDAAVIEIDSCSTRIDGVRYQALPEQGTLVFDGATAPDALLNDNPAAWCIDSAEDPDSTINFGVPGTPGSDNPVCSE